MHDEEIFQKRSFSGFFSPFKEIFLTRAFGGKACILLVSIEVIID